MEPAAYESDPYLRRLRTRVIGTGPHEEPWAVLENTLFYPEGGGQPADRGRINGVAVLDVQWKNGRVAHRTASPLKVGEAELELDWPRRFDHMQQHTGQHLLTAIAVARFQWNTTAFHLGEAVSDIEIDTPEVSAGQIEELEESVAAEIRNARTVRAWRVSREEFEALDVRTRGLPKGHGGSIRLVEIQGLDLNTCGGTHLTSTAQLECLKILSTEPMRGGTRLVYAAGGRLRRRMAEHEARNAQLRKILGTGDENLVSAVSEKLDRINVGSKRIRALQDDLADLWAGRLAAADSVVDAHFQGMDLKFLQKVGRAVAAGPSCKVCFLTANAEPADTAGVFLLAAGPSSGIDLAAIGPTIAEILGGRGGGSAHLFQGKCEMVSNRDRALQRLRRLAGETETEEDPGL